MRGSMSTGNLRWRSNRLRRWVFLEAQVSTGFAFLIVLAPLFVPVVIAAAGAQIVQRARSEGVARRARAQARREGQEWERRLREIASEITEVGGLLGDDASESLFEIPTMAESGTDLASLEQHLESLRSTWKSANSTLSRQLDVLRERELLAVLKGTASGTAETAGEVLARSANSRASTGETQAPPTPTGGPSQDSVGRILSRLEPDVSAERKLQITRFASGILQAPSTVRGAGLELELRHQVQSANEQARAEIADMQEARDLIASMRGLDSPELRVVLSDLVRVEARERPLGDDLRDRATEARAAALAQADHEYASEVIPQVLTDLGYEVESGFSTLFVERGIMHFQKPGWGEYGVRLRVENERVDFGVVRGSEPRGRTAREQRVRDTEIEAAWCAELPDVVDSLKAHGIDMRIGEQAFPGDRPIEIVDATGVGLSSMASIAEGSRRSDTRREKGTE